MSNLELNMMVTGTNLLSDNVVGTCSLCKGAVTCPNVYLRTVPPVPRCSRCGATKKDPYGPVIEMEKVPVPAGQFIRSDGTWTYPTMPGVTFTPLDCNQTYIGNMGQEVK